MPHLNVPISVKFLGFPYPSPSNGQSILAELGWTVTPSLQSFSFQRGNYTPRQTLILVSSFALCWHQKAWSCVRTPHCTTQYKAPILACPREGDTSSDPQLADFFHFSCIAFYFSMKFSYTYSALPGVSEQFKCQKDFLWK